MQHNDVFVKMKELGLDQVRPEYIILTGIGDGPK